MSNAARPIRDSHEVIKHCGKGERQRSRKARIITMWWQAGAWREAARCHGVLSGWEGLEVGSEEAGSAVVLELLLDGIILLPVATRSLGDAAEGNTSMTGLVVVRPLVGSRTSGYS